MPQNFWPYETMVQTYANQYGVDPETVRKIIQIESSGRPNERTGSYRGLMQLSPEEFAKYGGRGNIYDPEQNIAAGVRKIVAEANQFRQRYGREPTPQDIYMVHQQGPSGYAAHMANPSGTAWENIKSFYSSPERAKEAIWGNIPDTLKPRFGSVENVKSSDLTGIYGGMMSGTGWQSTVGTGPGYRPSADDVPVTPMEQAVRKFDWAPTSFKVPELPLAGATPEEQLKSIIKAFAGG